MDASDLSKHCTTPCEEGVVHIWEIVPQKHVVTTLELFPREVRPRVGERSSWFCVTNGMGTLEIPVSAASASFAHGILAVNGSGRVPDAPLQVSCPEFARRYSSQPVPRCTVDTRSSAVSASVGDQPLRYARSVQNAGIAPTASIRSQKRLAGRWRRAGALAVGVRGHRTINDSPPPSARYDCGYGPGRGTTSREYRWMLVDST
jgi:hypothetical protein